MPDGSNVFIGADCLGEGSCGSDCSDCPYMAIVGNAVSTVEGDVVSVLFGEKLPGNNNEENRLSNLRGDLDWVSI